MEMLTGVESKPYMQMLCSLHMHMDCKQMWKYLAISSINASSPV